MYSILIADDETIIRQGLKCIIDWDELGFTTISEASNGEDALSYILNEKPDVVLIDIRMPKLSGLEVVKEARAHGFNGKILILSGYSDFSYAQEAIANGVQFYLTKPIEEDELLKIIKEIASQIESEREHEQMIDNYKNKAKEHLLRDLLTGEFDSSAFHLEDINLSASQYQVLIYEKYGHNEKDPSYSFADLLRVTNRENNTFDWIEYENQNVILLKGEHALSRFEDFLERYQRNKRPQKGSPLDSIFIAYGRTVSKLEDIHISFQDSLLLVSRRFFCAKHQHTLGVNELPPQEEGSIHLTKNTLHSYADQLVNYIQIGNQDMVLDTLKDLESFLNRAPDSISDIRLSMTDLYLLVREKIYHLYNTIEIPFLSNAQIIHSIEHAYYLYEIINLMKEQFFMMIRSIGNTSSENIIDNIMHYIKHNYMNNIKLETIAPLFGYNSSYLGKIFNKKTGISFNSYVDNIRIEQSKYLLEHKALKVYEIAEKVGYQNVDYFHMKFKKHTGMSPAEYRKKNRTEKE